MTRDPLDAPATPDRLRALAGAGLLSAPALERALDLARARPDRESWYGFAHSRLLLVGACLCAAGVIFFVAANWGALHPWTRMGLVAGALVAAALAAGALGLGTLPGRAALLLSGLLFGPLVAIYGQTYQTGADAWELFTLWAAVFTGHALLARLGVTWMVWLALAHTAALAWTVQTLGGDLVAGDQAVALAVIAAADAALVALAQRLLPGSEGALLARSAAAVGLTLLTGVVAIVAGTLELQAGQWPSLVALPAAWAGMLWLYRRRRPDLFMLSLVAASVLVVASSLAGHVIFETLDLETWGFWLMGILVCAEVWLLARWMLRWRAVHQELEQDLERASGIPATRADAPAGEEPEARTATRTDEKPDTRTDTQTDKPDADTGEGMTPGGAP